MKSNSIFQPLRNIVLFLIISCVLFIGILGLVGCGNKDNIEPTPEPVPEEPTTPEEPPIIEKEYIKVYFEPPIKNFTVTRGYFDGENGLYFNQPTNKWIKHLGVDLTTSEDNPVISIYNGVVLEVIEQGEKGCIVVVDYGENLIVTYGSLESISVTIGQSLSIGDNIGTIGINRNKLGFEKHLCLEMTLDNVTIDPTPYINGTIYREVEKE